MTPKKGTLKHREPTVVYPRTSPELMLAYRIFGPGHESLESLANQRKSIIKPHQPEEWESPLTTEGMAIGRSVNVDVDEIREAYETYKKEIERMNKADRIHKKRKQAQLDGDHAQDEGEGSDDSDCVEVVGSRSKGSEDDVVIVDKDEDPLKQFLRPDLWLSRDDALSRMKSLRAGVEEMHATLSSILDNYNKEFTTHGEVSYAITISVVNFLAVRRYAYQLERLVTLHDSKTPESTWKSPDTANVTFGGKVTQALWRIYELEERVEDMQKSMAVCKRVRDRFLAAKPKPRATKLQLMMEVVFNLRRFATMCCTEEERAGFTKMLEEDQKEFEKNDKKTAEPSDPPRKRLKT